MTDGIESEDKGNSAIVGGGESEDIPESSDSPIIVDVEQPKDETPEEKKKREEEAKKKKKQEEEEEMRRVDILEYAYVVVDILIPVSITMLLVVIAVRMLNMSLEGGTISFAAFVYTESSGDSTSEKFLGALVNALIFLALIIVVTFVLVLLYKFHCIKLIIGWLVFSVVLLIGIVGAYFSYQLIGHMNWPVDYISFAFIIANITVVGAIATFWVAPRWLTQASLILISFLVATYFSQLPEWTTWAILIMIACYDLAAVLCPKGPLKMLLDTAQERNEPIPALLYNASVSMMMIDGDENSQSESSTAEETSGNEKPNSSTPMLAKPGEKENALSEGAATLTTSTAKIETESSSSSLNAKPSGPRPRKPLRRKRDEDDEEGGVKLGLGDFVFYSVLISRAPMTDMLTVFTSYTAIVTGLFGTLILLGIFKRALPALPISIALGTLFYFLSRLILLPFVMSNAHDEVFI